MRLIVTFLSMLSILLASPKNRLYIAACSNLGGTIEELASEFQKQNPNIKTEVTIASSGNLSAQIRHGARYQIFLSADLSHPQALFDDGFVTSKPVLYTKGALVLFSRTHRDLTQGMSLLLDGNISHIAIANPKTAPYGLAAQQALQRDKIFHKIKPKLVYANSISQTLAYSIMVTDAGLVALSSMYSKSMSGFKKGLNWIEIDPSLYTYTSQGMSVTKAGENDQNAKLFYDYMLSQDAQKILLNHGYKHR